MRPFPRRLSRRKHIAVSQTKGPALRITGIHERAIPISRYADPGIPSGGLDTSIVAIGTDAFREGRRVVGYGFSSMGRYAQGGLIRERFAPRLAAAPPSKLLGDDGRFDPALAWEAMMAGEKPGGHGDRSVAVGTLDMALWDIAAKLAGLPLHALLSDRLGRAPVTDVAVYAGGGYRYPADDLSRLRRELRGFLDVGYTRAKMKIGGVPFGDDLRRVEAACGVVSPGGMAADAMNSFGATECLAAATALADLRLWWLEDVCDPLDFETQSRAAATYPGPIAAGEALFSEPEARLLARHGGLRPDRDMLVFDPVHCYGLPGYLRIIASFEGSGWPRRAFWPHGGHLFSLHVAAALDLGGAEVNPLAFAPFGGLSDGAAVHGGRVRLPHVPGIGFEHKADLWSLLAGLIP